MRLPDINKNRSVQSKIARCRLVSLLSLAVFLVSACSTPGESSKAALQADAKGDSLLIVDCLLPGQVRQLTSRTRHVTSKRPIKTSGQDCGNRGGEFTAFDRADYATALKVWLARAVDGDAEAQNYVGEIYEKGLGVDPDYKTAAAWYERAAQQEFSRSFINLANLYEKGLGVERDAVRAMNLYRRASGIDWEVLGYAASFVSVSQIQATISSRQAQVSNLKREQQSLQESLQATKAQLAREKARETARLAEKKRAGENSNNSKVTFETEQIVPFFPPEILIYDPAITLTRAGGATVLLDSQAEFINVVGKISASEGVSEAYLNGERLKTDEFDLFFTIMPVTELPENVKIFAADRQQNSTEFDFTLQSTSPEMMASYQRKPPEKGDSALGSYHALVIGNSDYGSFPKHPAGAANAVEVKTLLEEKYGFNSTLLLNATRYQVLFAINELRDRLETNDNLLIYYAGRCEADQSNRPAYWLPVDAEPQDSSRWISNVAVSDLLNTVQSNRVMVVSDSCYAGTFTTAAISRTAVPEGTQGYRQWVESMKDVRARTVLASGAEQSQLLQEGVKQSFFTKTFLDVLRKNEQIIDGNSVYVEMLKTMAQSEVMKSAGSAPTYEAIKYAGHEAGEFFFRPLI